MTIRCQASWASFWIISHVCNGKLDTGTKRQVRAPQRPVDRRRRKSTHTARRRTQALEVFHHVTLDSAAIQVLSSTDPVPYIGTQDCQKSHWKLKLRYTRQVQVFWNFLSLQKVWYFAFRYIIGSLFSHCIYICSLYQHFYFMGLHICLFICLFILNLPYLQ